MSELIKEKIKNSLWGLFIGDSLAMPVHWYYNTNNIQNDFPGGITKYEAPKHPHPESFMVGMEYRPDTKKARELGRPYDILHNHAQFYKTSYSDLTIERNEREDQHGNAVPTLENRYHYHHGLKAGDNTIGALLVRVLLRQIIETGTYHPEHFIKDFVEYLTEPEGANAPSNDPYREIYIRRWFENYSRGTEEHNCADTQRRTWSIGSHGGMIRPMVVSLINAGNAYKAVGNAIEHQNITHRSENIVSALHVVIPLMHELLKGAAVEETLQRFSGQLNLPKIHGDKLFEQYRNHNGPGNIPDDVMWRLHTEYEKEPWDIVQFAEENTLEEVVGKRLATACYPEHGVPLLLYLIYINRGKLGQSLFDNANAGGDNVHRGMVAGMIAGAANDSIPQELMEGLSDFKQIKQEIDSFVDIVSEND